MKKSDWLQHISDAEIFLICYSISLSINLFLGFGQIVFGNLVIYSIIFGILEIIKILLLKWKARIILFFANIYIAYCLTGFYFVVRDKANLVLKTILSIRLNEYIFLLGISVLLSFLGYIFLIIHPINHKDVKK